ncbi:ComEC/Rec2 family competence protein [Candidatus Woesebacteria bacterium]|nr:ComEC/Rec2 family competence protein [Candidatus Woesebacteria bacterium]
MKKKLLVAITAFLIIFIRYQTTTSNYEVGQRIKISSRVKTEPINYTDSQRIVLEGFIFYLPNYPRIEYGDDLIIEAEVGDRYLKNVKIIDHQKPDSIAFKLRRQVNSFYRSAIPEPHSSLIAGMTIGSKASIPEKFWESLKRSGTAHVVVASGMNITLVSMFLLSILILFLPRNKALWVALAGVWGYAFISGFDAPIVRAAIMGSIAFWAQAAGRLNFAWRSLFISAFLMVIIKPHWLTDLGFILSFSATASLMLFEAKIRKKIQFIPSIFREGLSTSLAAQIFVAPIMFVTFGQFSLVSPVVNALVLWTVPLITIIGMLSAIFGLVWFELGMMVLYLTYPLTSWFIFVVELFS